MAKQELPPWAEFFRELEDPRRETLNRRHKLVDMFVIAVAGMVCGADTWKEMELFAKTKESWLRSFLELPNGIPSHHTLGRVFGLVKSDALSGCFSSYVAALLSDAGSDGPVRKKVVAIDGKTIRRSFDKGGDQRASHTVSAWDTKNRVVLGQCKTDEKSNEITAIPELLELLSLKDVVVTIDAMGCQKDIARRIKKQGGDYILALKGNQELLAEDVGHFFDACVSPGLDPDEWSTHEVSNTGHGRQELRRCYATQNLSDIRRQHAWPGLKSLVVIDRERTLNGQTSSERQLYISSLAWKARTFLPAVRGHWEIENSLHWVLDMVFREDECRVRIGNAASNLAVIRHLALNLLRQAKKYDIGIKGRRLAAALDHEFLLDVIMTMPT
jgi:predicted transposase YbfD/YdcC